MESSPTSSTKADESAPLGSAGQPEFVGSARYCSEDSNRHPKGQFRSIPRLAASGAIIGIVHMSKEIIADEEAPKEPLVAVGRVFQTLEI